MCTAMPPTSPSRSSTSPVCSPTTKLDADAAQLVSEGGRAADPAARPVEGGQQPVAGRLDQPAAELLNQAAGQLVVHVQQLAPAPVPQPAGAFGGGDDVGKQHGGQHPIGLDGPVDAGQELLDQVQGEFRRLPGQRRVGSWQLDQLGSGDVLGQVAALLDRERLTSRRCRMRVGAWTSAGWSARRRPSWRARYGWAVLGFRLVRCAFANQRRNRASSAAGHQHCGHGLGTTAGRTGPAGPRRPRGEPRSGSRAGHTLAEVCTRMRALVRSSGAGGRRSPRRPVRQDRRSAGADRVQDRGQLLGIGLQGAGDRVAAGRRHLPRRLNRITREKDASERRNRASPGSSQVLSRWPRLAPVMTRSGGPWPRPGRRSGRGPARHRLSPAARPLQPPAILSRF